MIPSKDSLPKGNGDGKDETKEVSNRAQFDSLKHLLGAERKNPSFWKLPRLFLISARIVFQVDAGAFLLLLTLHLLHAGGSFLQVLFGKSAVTAFVEGSSPGEGLQQAARHLASIAAVAAAMKIISAVLGHRKSHLSATTTRRCLDEVLEVASKLDLAAFETPELFSRLKRAESAGSSSYRLVGGALDLAGSVTGFISIALALAAIEPMLLIPILIAGIPSWIVRKRNTQDRFDWTIRTLDLQRRRNYLLSLLTGREEAKEVRAFELGSALRERFESASNELDRTRLQSSRRTSSREVVGGLTTMALNALILAIVGYLAVRGRIDIGPLGAAIVALQMLSARTELLSSGLDGLYASALFVDDYLEFLKLEAGQQHEETSSPAPANLLPLRLDHVSFSYPESNRMALTDVCVQISQGEIVALVGENGSGKTTLAKVIAGLYRPTEGDVFYNDVSLDEINPTSLREKIAIIFQDFVRYKLSARDNIAFGNYKRVSDSQEIVKAAERSGADEFLQGLPSGYETLLSKEFPGGADLSVGQWQRIALARAFFRDAPLLILDEPTSALDPRAERQLFDQMRSLAQGRTVLLISHRFSSVRQADRIFVLDQGQLVEQGTHAELVALGGLYAELYQLQAAAYLESDQAEETTSAC